MVFTKNNVNTSKSHHSLHAGTIASLQICFPLFFHTLLRIIRSHMKATGAPCTLAVRVCLSIAFLIFLLSFYYNFLLFLVCFVLSFSWWFSWTICTCTFVRLCPSLLTCLCENIKQQKTKADISVPAWDMLKLQG